MATKRKSKNWNPFKSLLSKKQKPDHEEEEIRYIFEIEEIPEKEYKILGLEEYVTDYEVKQRYRYLIKKHHPDRGGDPKKFKKIKKAYDKIMEYRTTD